MSTISNAPNDSDPPNATNTASTATGTGTDVGAGTGTGHSNSLSAPGVRTSSLRKTNLSVPAMLQSIPRSLMKVNGDGDVGADAGGVDDAGYADDADADADGGDGGGDSERGAGDSEDGGDGDEAVVVVGDGITSIHADVPKSTTPATGGDPGVSPSTTPSVASGTAPAAAASGAATATAATTAAGGDAGATPSAASSCSLSDSRPSLTGAPAGAAGAAGGGDGTRSTTTSTAPAGGGAAAAAVGTVVAQSNVAESVGQWSPMSRLRWLQTISATPTRPSERLVSSLRLCFAFYDVDVLRDAIASMASFFESAVPAALGGEAHPIPSITPIPSVPPITPSPSPIRDGDGDGDAVHSPSLPSSSETVPSGSITRGAVVDVIPLCHSTTPGCRVWRMPSLSAGVRLRAVALTEADDVMPPRSASVGVPVSTTSTSSTSSTSASSSASSASPSILLTLSTAADRISLQIPRFEDDIPADSTPTRGRCGARLCVSASRSGSGAVPRDVLEGIRICRATHISTAETPAHWVVDVLLSDSVLEELFGVEHSDIQIEVEVVSR